MVECSVIHHPPLDFHGASGRGCCPWLCKHAPLSRSGADGPHAEKRAIAADDRIARVPCDKFLFFVFLTEALKKTRSVRLKKKGPAKKQTVGFYLNSLMLSLSEDILKVVTK